MWMVQKRRKRLENSDPFPVFSTLADYSSNLLKERLSFSPQGILKTTSMYAEVVFAKV